ncbi:hypothetical protein HOP52_10440 [Halomonas campisalis]|uniref:Uncharacterized protein n=1 Tax=Billgrantia campisalis TaxID=74661 RepID=A0ABS9P8S6_9GAMM|nr:hypothetical protein [Halomonas campisalis]MCG6658172.1 hypothetical protein [Halomonas campisalis]MDR5862841.1 hypothetical protein [Halomonas campisalis]
MSHRFIEVVTDYPTTEQVYTLLLQIEQIVHIRPEAEAENEPRHEPGAVVTLANGEVLILKTPYAKLAQELDEVNMVLRP